MTFNFNEYLLKEPETQEIKPQEQQQAQEIEQQEPFSFDKYRDKEEMGMVGEIGRHLTRTGSRIGETILGLPGNTVQFANWLGSKLPELPNFLKREPNFLQKMGQELVSSFPTSDELKQKSSEITEGFTDPQGAWEEFGDSVAELSSILMYGKDPTKLTNITSSLSKALVAKSAKKGAEKYGVGEYGQLGVEFGTLFLMGLTDSDMANKYVSDQYKQSASKIPKNTMLPSVSLENELVKLENDLSVGISTASKNEVKSAVSELKNKSKGGSIPAKDLVESYHDINERMSSKKLFDELSTTERKKLKYRYDKFKNVVGDEIDEYGKYNPEFSQQWRGANQAFKTIEDSKKYTRNLESLVGKLPPKIIGSMAFELLSGYPEVALGTGIAYSGLKTGELMYRVAKSPVLRKAYMNAVEATLAENTPALIKAVNQLNSGLEDSFGVPVKK